MSNTCGYLCPQCEGRGYLEDGQTCDWCSPIEPDKISPKSITQTTKVEEKDPEHPNQDLIDRA